MLTQSEVAADEMQKLPRLKRVDWNLCTHVISGDERGDGGTILLYCMKSLEDL